MRTVGAWGYRHFQQPRDHLHLALSCAQSALNKTLAGRHAPDVIVENEPGSQQ